MSKKKKNKAAAMMPVLPKGFITQMKTLLGEEETGELISSLEAIPSVSIRVNRAKVADPKEFIRRFNDFHPSPVPWCESGYYLENRPDFIHDPLLHAGTYYVQEAASMVYETLLADYLNALPSSKSSLKILDLCAAPGGKTTALLNALVSTPEPMKYLLVANEFDSRRVKILKENLDKWGDPNVIVTNSDTEKFAELEEVFDVIAVDAPCSGEGMMRREPIARSQWSEGLILQCSALQKEILNNAVAALRPGGLLIFSTCTFNEKENEENVEWLMQTHELESVGFPRHFYPHRDRCEGLFVAPFRKRDQDTELSPTVENLSSRLKKAGIRVIGEGIEKVVMKGNMEIPSSRQVLAHDYDKASFPNVELDRNQALAYLRRNSLALPPETPTGYVAVSYEGYPLGLMKNLGNRANNLYPSDWRVIT